MRKGFSSHFIIINTNRRDKLAHGHIMDYRTESKTSLPKAHRFTGVNMDKKDTHTYEQNDGAGIRMTVHTSHRECVNTTQKYEILDSLTG